MRHEFVDKALLIESENKRILVIADLHMGYEEMLNEQGVLIPRTMFREIMGELNKVFDYVSKGNGGVAEEKKNEKAIDEVVILGDLKHEFGIVNRQEWQDVKKVLDFLKEKSEKIVLIRGNHDKIIEPIAGRMGIEIRDFYVLGEIAFLHGDKMYAKVLDEKIKTLIMGHMHPAVTLKDKDGKSERYKCFLVGGWKDKEIVILPSFFPLVEGADVFIENNKMAFNFDLKSFEVYAVGEGKVYGFGKIGEMMKDLRQD